jgi:hypothetical protein
MIMRIVDPLRDPSQELIHRGRVVLDSLVGTPGKFEVWSKRMSIGRFNFS